MDTNCISLRSQVDKWLAPTMSMPARVTDVGRLIKDRSRYVKLEGRTNSGPLTIIFFRHVDGSWSVFPPAPNSPTMCARLFA
jgi:hypothetical protein